MPHPFLNKKERREVERGEGEMKGEREGCGEETKKQTPRKGFKNRTVRGLAQQTLF